MPAIAPHLQASPVPVNQELFTVPRSPKPRRKRRSHLLMVCEEYTLAMLAGRPSTSMCYIVSIGLEGYLNCFEGMDCKAVEGMVGNDHHWWIELRDGRIIDATADQFNGSGNPDMPLVYIGSLPSWYRPNDAEFHAVEGEGR